MRRALVAALLLWAAPLSAQGIERKEVEPGQWLTSYIPFIAAAPNDGPTIEFRAWHWKKAEWGDRVTNAVQLTGRAGWSPRGSWLAIGRLEWPRLADGWRLAAQVQATHDQRWGYYGLGNTIDADRNLETDAQPYYNQVRRRRLLGYADVTRRLTGPLSASVAVYGTSANFDARPGPSYFREDFAEAFTQNEASARLALVLDLRDREYDVRRGALIEGGYQVGVSAETYGRWYGIARGWVSPTATTVLSARAFAANLTGTPTLESRLTLPAWERTMSTLGGEESHRGVPNGRFTGRGVIGTTVEVRQAVKDFEGFGAVGVLGFVDGGRVFETEPWTLTFDDWTVGGGGGIWLRVMQGNVLQFTAGFAEGESFLGFRTAWSF
ncbi:MAG TPA: BamA/TamA family outer membrane protein [Gemmatimonadales bacterium]|nr:BamA/TamA family outer membrane protein [Gemmatimonadales bacterium]